VEPFVEKMPRGIVFEDLESPPVSPPRAEKTPVLVDIVKEEAMVAIEEGILEEMEEMEEMEEKPCSPPHPSPEVEVAKKNFA
jgi:hypothetical protein